MCNFNECEELCNYPVVSKIDFSDRELRWNQHLLWGQRSLADILSAIILLTPKLNQPAAIV